MNIYLDIDAHKVLAQALHAAQRHAFELYVVTRDYLRAGDNVHLILVEDRQANRGGWIAANILRGDICVTGDPELAASCILRGAAALSPIGRQWSGDGVNDDIARGAAGNLSERWMPDARLFAQRLERAIVAGPGADPGPLRPSRPLGRGATVTELGRPISRVVHG
jgi:uncharacterized protein YaiI (UPF0178 family)